MIEIPLLNRIDADRATFHFQRFLSRIKKSDYLHYPWVILWDINHFCNLRCVYCDLHSDRHFKDPLEVLEGIIELRPKMLTISGGEPMLMKPIREIIERVRKEIDPFFVLNTNLTRNLDDLIELLDRLDVLHTSIDGLGEINTRTRGMSGDEILAGLDRIAQRVEEIPRTKILTMSVMTIHNWENAAEMIRRVSGISPKICMALGVQEPYYHPESLGSHPDLMKRLVEQVSPLLEKNRIMLTGVLGTIGQVQEKTEIPLAPTKPQETMVNCPRQFFRLMIDPMGNYSTCKSRFFMDYFAGQFHSLWGDQNYIGAAKMAGRALKSLAMKPNETSCWVPCKCEEFLDDILLAQDGDPVRSNTYQFENAFDSEEIAKVEGWMVPHLGHGLSTEIRSILKKNDTPET